MLKLELGYGQEEIVGEMEGKMNDGQGQRGAFPAGITSQVWVLWPKLNPRIRSQVSGKICNLLPKGLCENKV